ncbi:MAG: MFS transporter [Actinophytocola sp.]|nr:MFS transporter [Actinophytocola sp.]
MFAMTTACAFQYGLPYLIPALRADGLSLSEAGILMSCPIAGLLLTLVAWGAAADRWGERLVLSSGLALATLALTGATLSQDHRSLGVALFLAGAAGASVHAASGRLVLGWFATHERGFAMAVRQTSQPLGIAIGALALPPLTGDGLWPGLLFLTTLCLLATGFVVAAVRDPVRTAEQVAASPGSPYRTPTLWRIHAASVLLIPSQFGIATFALAYLVEDQDWDPAPAGRALAIAAIGGAGARLLAGYWSDRVGSRLRPLRFVALGIGGLMLAVATGTMAGPVVASITVLLVAVITVSPNGLAFTAVAEHAGYSWAGRALGVQNTLQNACAAAALPVLGGVIGAIGYGSTFGVIALFPLMAVALIPVAAEHH